MMQYISEFLKNNVMGYAVYQLLRDECGRAIDFIIIDINSVACELLEIDIESAIGKTARECWKDVNDAVIKRYETVVKTGESYRFSIKYQYLNKELEVMSCRVDNERFACSYRLKAKVEEKAAIKAKEIAKRNGSMVASVDANWVYTYANKAYSEFLRCEDITGTTFTKYINEIHSFDIWHVYEKMMIENKPQKLILNHANGSIIEWSISPVSDDEGFNCGASIIGYDVTEIRKENNEMKVRVQYDALTGLLNRAYLVELAEKELDNCAKAVGVLIDIDNFKKINDLFGHAIGDTYLKNIASILKQVAPYDSLICRITGDEFFIFTPQYKSKEWINEIVANILKAIGNITTVSIDQSARINASAGIAYYEDDADNIEKLISAADIAMFRAKQAGKHQYKSFKKDYKRTSMKTFHFMQDINRAIKEEEFFMVYQPIVTLNDMKINQVEALMRWNHPERGILTPYHFIQIAELSGAIVDIGYQLLDQVAKQMRKWDDENNFYVNMSVNLSPIQLTLEDFAPKLKYIFDEYRIDLNRICVEITERTIFDQTTIAKENIEKLKAYGVQIAIDDFGTEYSTLARLDEIDFDVIKIDRSFVSKIQHSFVSQTVVDMIHKIIYKLNKKCVVEGVETETQLKIISDMGFNDIQGYYFSKPVEHHDIFQVEEQISRSKLIS